MLGELERDRGNPLGAFLRARREQVTPQQAGLPTGGVRRVPGLRREELAMLAGISADYYLRLERGKDRRPSAQVLDALARALRLDRDLRTHLHVLAAGSSGDAPARPSADGGDEVSRSGATDLVAALNQPAFVEDRHLDVLAANPLARALNPRLRAGRNQLRDLFLDREEQALHPDWELAAACLTASLRHTVGGATDDPRFVGLTTELGRSSAVFRRIWARHEVRAQRGASVRLDHPAVGMLTLRREQMSLNGAEGLNLVVYYPAPTSTDREKLALLTGTR